jgi:predicted flavoprotein YhiN
MALGALIIKEKLGISDREMVEQVRENPCLQYFTGLKNYRNEAPFEASMLVHFRQRLEIDLVNKINIKMCEEGRGEVNTEKKLSKVVRKKRV